jgi:hypothetical protein
MFQPDIIVAGPGGITLVVEAKTSMPNLLQTEKQICEYMISMSCPTGLLITPERMWIYRDQYSSPPHIERIGEFAMSTIWPQQPPEGGAPFESFVQAWLEQLPQQTKKKLPRGLDETFREYLLPALASGEVRAAHPRYS